jgi:hypothetical protein
MMKFLSIVTLLLTTVALRAAIVIDNFQTPQSLGSDGDPYPATDWVQGAGIYGGERDLYIWNDQEGEVTSTISFESFLYTQDANSSSEFTLVWGGLDSMAGEPRSREAGFIDLVAENVLSMDVSYGALSFVGSESVVVRFITGNWHFSHIIQITAEDSNSTIHFDISDFNMGTEASDVRAIWLEHGLFGQGESSIEITNVEFSVVPEPATPVLCVVAVTQLALFRRRRLC